MPGRNLIGRCSECCNPAVPAIEITCTSRTTSAAYLEGYGPYIDPPEDECPRYRLKSGTYAIDDYVGTGPLGGSCGGCTPGQYEETRTGTATGSQPFGGAVTKSGTETRTDCFGTSSVDISSNWNFGEGGTVLSATQKQLVDTAGSTAGCVTNGTGTGVEHVDRYRSGTVTLSDLDTFDAARARAGSPTFGDSCCAETGEVDPDNPCMEGESTTVTLTISATGGTPAEVWEIVLTFSDLSTATGTLTLDGSGNDEIEIDVPQPAAGATPICWEGLYQLRLL